jgi:hypothetical protein
MADILATIFQLAAFRHGSQDWAKESILAHPEMANVLYTLASCTDDYLKWAQVDPLTKQDTLRGIDDQLTHLVRFITDHLNTWSNRSSSSENASLARDVLFYLSSIFSWQLFQWSAPPKILGNQDSHLGQALRSLLNALHKVWSSGRKNDLLEKQFESRGWGVERFSNEWWDDVFKHLSNAPFVAQGANISSHFTYLNIISSYRSQFCSGGTSRCSS